MRYTTLLAAAFATISALATAGTAQAEFPEKEITVIVNYGAGGATDLSTRTLARAMEKVLNVPLKVVNRPGGAGTVGPTILANSPNDGYTIGVTSFSPMAIQPAMREVPYSLEDFDVIGAAKAGKVTVSAAGPPNNIALHQLAGATGGTFEWIPYSGGNEAIVALLSGEVDAAAQNPTDIVKHVESGALRMLVSMSPVRWFELPDVPTLLDLGYDIQIDSWAGLSAPAGVEASRLKVLEDAVSSAMNDSEVQGQFKNVGMDPAFMPGEEYQTFLRDGKETIAKQLKEIGMIE